MDCPNAVDKRPKAVDTVEKGKTKVEGEGNSAKFCLGKGDVERLFVGA